ncbi:MAG: 23S rRNA (pseudouridine(1915)-N(3))-methyltransferase RlmH [Bacteroidales bacterium]|nr:23S rRNA (pseudouridine(1915)-N(3))-methyltransferase RlmH [Bacteroidales bacterium]
MKIVFLVIGKTDESYLDTGILKYIKRLEHYVPFEMKIIPDIKNRKTLTEEQQKKSEGELILSNINIGDDLVLLDENGKTFSSVAFSQWIEKQMNIGSKRMIFVVGGPYGFSKEVYAKAKFKISLSEMTFSHQMIRLIFVEQLYRAFTIIKGEPYHHV